MSTDIECIITVFVWLIISFILIPFLGYNKKEDNNYKITAYIVIVSGKIILSII